MSRANSTEYSRINGHTRLHPCDKRSVYFNCNDCEEPDDARERGGVNMPDVRRQSQGYGVLALQKPSQRRFVLAAKTALLERIPRMQRLVSVIE